MPDFERSNLIVALHPHCPCSRASIAELAEIMLRCEGLVTAHVLFLKPSQMPDGWEVSALWHQAALIPGVRVVADDEGREAQRFGATTSGHVGLYDLAGRLVFRGGITIARGHAGDNDGRHMIIDRLSGATSLLAENAVFGCPLFEVPPQVERSGFARTAAP